MSTKQPTLRARFGYILLWSVISAAFIGPGTVTTAAAAGASYGTALAWALVFSTIGCFVLQEAAARLSIIGGLSLGQALNQGRFGVVGAVVFGCIAYEAGNLLGAYAGIALVVDLPRWVVLLVLGFAGVSLLSLNRAERLAKILGVLVLILGASFVILAFGVPVTGTAVARGAFVPSFPEGSSLLIIGLIGTTIVPYNLFLGSSIGVPEDGVGAMRFGLGISIFLGGLFSLAILLVGSSLSGEFSFAALAGYLDSQWGTLGTYLLAAGLFIAGLTSTLTAPFAAALAVQAVVPPGSPDTEKRYYNITWAVVLGIGLLIGLLNVKVIPVIILAQAANGFVLPIVSGFLLWAVNQPQYMGDRLNGRLGNALFVIVLTISLFLGFDNLLKALDGALDLSLRGNTTVTYIELGLAVVLSGVILWFATKNRRKVAD